MGVLDRCVLGAASHPLVHPSAVYGAQRVEAVDALVNDVELVVLTGQAVLAAGRRCEAGVQGITFLVLKS